MKKLLLALFLLAPLNAHAQSTKAIVIDMIDTNFPDNTANLITAQDLRDVTTNMVSSYLDYITCTTAGGMITWVTPGATPACVSPGSDGQILQYQSSSTSPITWASAATAGQFQSATANKFLDAAGVFAAASVSAITAGVTTFSTDWNTGFNFSANVTQTSTLPNPTNVKVGQTGCYFFTQGASTTGTISSYGSFWKFANGISPTLSTSPSAIDALCYVARTTSWIFGTLSSDIR